MKRKWIILIVVVFIILIIAAIIIVLKVTKKDEQGNPEITLDQKLNRFIEIVKV